MRAVCISQSGASAEPTRPSKIKTQRRKAAKNCNSGSATAQRNPDDLSHPAAELIPVGAFATEDVRDIEPGSRRRGLILQFLHVQPLLGDHRPEVTKPFVLCLLVGLLGLARPIVRVAFVG